MDQNLLDGIMQELWSVKPREDTGPNLVRRSQVLERAKWMTENMGYVHSEETVEAVCLWMKGYGLMLMGKVGCGKSSFFKCLGDSRIRFWSPLVDMAKRLDEIEECIDQMNGNELVIDDVGSEPVYNNFGVRLDLIPWVVEKRMQLCARTHFTTNLSAEELVKRYGPRVVSRMHELTKVVNIKGVSKRRTKVFKTNTNER